MCSIEISSSDILTGETPCNQIDQGKNFPFRHGDSRVEYSFDSQKLRAVATRIVDQALKIRPLETSTTTGEFHQSDIKDENRVKLLIQFHSTGWQLSSMVAEIARERGAIVVLRYNDNDYTNRMLSELTGAALPALAVSQLKKEGKDESQLSPQERIQFALHYGVGNDQLEDYLWATKVLIIRNKAAQDFELAHPKKTH